MNVELDRSNYAAQILDKRQRDFDKTIAESRQKQEEVLTDYEEIQKEVRNVTTEMFKTKIAYEEAADALDTIKREKINLQEWRSTLEYLAQLTN